MKATHYLLTSTDRLTVIYSKHVAYNAGILEKESDLKN